MSPERHFERVEDIERIPAQELSLLLEVSAGLASSLDLATVLQSAVDSTVRVLGLETGAIYLLEGDEMYLGATYPRLPSDMPDSLRRTPLAGHDHIGRCLATRRAVFVPDVAVEEFTDIEREVCESRQLRAILYVPIATEAAVLGVVIMGTQTRTHTFGAHDADLCQTLSYQVALAVTNARLYGELREANHELDQHRQHLQVLVDQRTRELEAANLALDESNEELQCINEELLAMNEELNAAVEEAGRANAEIRRTAEAKSRFLANMSHELRTPLHAALGLTRVLRSELSGPLNEEQHRQLSMIEQAGRELLTLVDGVLDLSKVEAGRIDLAAEEFHPAELVAVVLEALRPLADEKSLTLAFDEADGEAVMHSDPARIRQILVNLVGNAIKFTSAGAVRVRLAATDGETVVFSVTDTGRGIPPEDIERIFESYAQAGTHPTPGQGGTGLGLTLSRELATLLGGSLSAESEPGAGSCFTLLLPCRMPGVADD